MDRATREKFAEAVGISASTVYRLDYIERVEADDSLPDALRTIAREERAKLHAKHRAMTKGSMAAGVRYAYERVRDAYRETWVTVWYCQTCGAELTSEDHRPDARYCSGACRQKAYRQRL